MSALPTEESGCSSWPTTTTTDHKGSSKPGQRRGQLSEAAEQLWPTASAMDSVSSGSAGYAKTATHNVGTTLTDAAVRQPSWATPRASLNENYMTKPAPTHGVSHGETLAKQASLWMTPDTGSQGGRSTLSGKSQMHLKEQVELIWATPKACDSNKPSASNRRGDDLTQQMKVWPTPDAQQGTGYMSGANRDTWRPTLEGAAQGKRPVLHSGRQAPTAIGPRSRRVLNPRFVCWLMNLPIGWSEPTPIDRTSFAAWATAWFQRVARWRSYFLRQERASFARCSERGSDAP